MKMNHFVTTSGHGSSTELQGLNARLFIRVLCGNAEYVIQVKLQESHHNIDEYVFAL